MSATHVVEQLAKTLVRVESSVVTPVPVPDDLEADYLQFLSLCNGGYTEDWYFHFFGSAGPPPHNVAEWNKPECWKRDFELGEEAFVFAETIFGTQYYFTRGRRRVIKGLWIHEGKSVLAAANFSEFVRDIVLDKSTHKQARALAGRFLEQSGTPNEPFQHISYISLPFFGGSEDDIGNMEWADSIGHLKFIGQLSSQLRSFPAGTRFIDVIVDKATGRVTLVPE